MALEYENHWVGRYYVESGTLMGLSLLPSVAYRATDRLSLGASLNATYGILDDRVRINRAGTGPDGKLELDDRAWGFGLNLGLLYELDDATRVGITYNSEIELDFAPTARFSGAGPVLEALLRLRGLLDAQLGMEVYVPQGVNLSLFRQIDDRWALLGSAGWQDWSRFGRVNVSIDDTDNPRSATADLDFEDTWHLALGAQYRLSAPWLLSFGMAYDSKFQDPSRIGPMLPINDGWRFGLGIQNQAAKDVEWGVAAEYVYAGSTDVDKQGITPAVGGRGDLVGSYQPWMLFLSANASWKF
jgi:long-chain fatty acid transport protein